MTTTFTTGGLELVVDRRPARWRRRERVEAFGQLGLTIGIVTNNKDPDGVGRVRVKFPALSDQEESWWARVVDAGRRLPAGLMFMPQIDDEVLVGFEHGDLRRPFVLGGLWGAKAKPPTASGDVPRQQNKVIDWGLRRPPGTTLAFRGGDKPADKHFKLALADGTTLYLGSDKTEIIAMNKSIELKSGQASILITGPGRHPDQGRQHHDRGHAGRRPIERADDRRQGEDVAQGRGLGGARAEGRRHRQARGLAASPRSRARW